MRTFQHALAVLVIAAGVLAPSDRAVASIPGCSSGSSPIELLIGDQRPVVLVHGYNGEPLTQTAGQLQGTLGAGWRTFTFDYAARAGEWAAADQVAGCLAEYVSALSTRSLDNGGSGGVYLVGHSMGGLAARFAAARAIGGSPVSEMIAGVVTLGTPHTGSPWADTPYTAVVEALEGRLPNPFGRNDPSASGGMASQCLAMHNRGQDMRSGCAAPPYLDKAIPLTQVTSVVTVRRTLFGFDLYDINLGGDSVVPVESAGGYIGSAQGQLSAGTMLGVRQVDCAVTSERIYGFAAVAGVTLVNRGAGDLLGRLDKDVAAMDAILGGYPDPALLQFLVLANVVADCGHIPLSSNSRALTITADALRSFPERQVTSARGNNDVGSADTPQQAVACPGVDELIQAYEEDGVGAGNANDADFIVCAGGYAAASLFGPGLPDGIHALFSWGPAGLQYLAGGTDSQVCAAIGTATARYASVVVPAEYADILRCSTV